MATTDFYGIAKKYPQFNKEQVDTFIEAFKQFDQDGNGSIDVKELGTVLKNIGENVDTMTLKKHIAEVDTDNSGAVEWGEFLEVG